MLYFLAANKAKTSIEGYSLKHTADESSASEDYIFIKSNYKLVKVELKDIIYIEGLKDYVKFYTVNSEKPILSLMSLKRLEEDLHKKKFMRTHRSYIVNLKKVTTIERNRIVFGEKYIPVSKKYKEAFHEFICSKGSFN